MNQEDSNDEEMLGKRKHSEGFTSNIQNMREIRPITLLPIFNKTDEQNTNFYTNLVVG
jgi:hypothetical protein